jgi:HD superfamily phosphodiesterase
MGNPLEALRALVADRYHAIPEPERHTQYEAHWWDHISRVVRNCDDLAREECVDGDHRNVLVASALCHDICLASPGEDDVVDSSRECRKLMAQCGFSDEESDLGASLVLATDRDVKAPTSLLERIIYTGDKLDLFGIDGTVRLVIQEARRGLTTRDAIAARITERQAQWLSFMESLDVGQRLVQMRAGEAKAVLDALGAIES